MTGADDCDVGRITSVSQVVDVGHVMTGAVDRVVGRACCASYASCMSTSST
jgi:hypothetical protein